MPRLEDRQVRLAILRDTEGRNRARFLLPFSIERPGFSIGAPIIRAWANPFGPLGTPLIDGEGAAESIDNLLEALGAARIRTAACSGSPRCPHRWTSNTADQGRRHGPQSARDHHQYPRTRRCWKALMDGEPICAIRISAKHHARTAPPMAQAGDNGRADLQRCPPARRHPPAHGRIPAAGSQRLEGPEKSAMSMDRYRAAFAREASTIWPPPTRSAFTPSI